MKNFKSKSAFVTYNKFINGFRTEIYFAETTDTHIKCLVINICENKWFAYKRSIEAVKWKTLFVIRFAEVYWINIVDVQTMCLRNKQWFRKCREVLKKTKLNFKNGESSFPQRLVSFLWKVFSAGLELSWLECRAWAERPSWPVIHIPHGGCQLLQSLSQTRPVLRAAESSKLKAKH